MSSVSEALTGEVDLAITTERQNEALTKARKCLVEADELLGSKASPDLVSFSLREALDGIHGALGKNVGEDIMDRVFKEFCIGK